MNVKVYIRTTEPWSQTLVKYLQSKNIEFTKVEVSIDREGFREMIHKSGQKNVPVIEIDGQILVGFNARYIDELLSARPPHSDQAILEPPQQAAG